MIKTLLLSATILTTLVQLYASQAQAADIKIGDINSYSALPAFAEPYRKGWQMAVDEINVAGGINGDKLVIISKDDAGKPSTAVTAANELIAQDGVVMLIGGYFSNVGLAISDYARQKKVMYLAGEPLTDAITWSKGNAYTFRLRPSNYMQASMLAEQAAKLPAKRWATIAPNYEYGQSAVAIFQELLKKKRPDVTFVAEQWPPQGKIDAGSVAEAINAAHPDAILNVEFAADLVKLVREGSARNLFQNRPVVSFLTGDPEYLDALKSDTPSGWIVTGYPWADVHTPANDAFVKAYEAKYSDYPRIGSVIGYSEIEAIAAIMKRAKSTDTDNLVKAAEGASFDTPFGTVMFRKIDHQSTMGAFVGKTAVVDGKGKMVDFQYEPGDKFLPSDSEVKTLRPQG